MANIVVFGVQDFASLAHFYFSEDSEHTVVGFCVDRAYLKETKFEGLPVVAFEDLEAHFPPSKVKMFVPMTQARMGRLRQEKYENCKTRGYSFVSYVSSKATTWKNVEIGENCFILEDNTLQPFSKIGNNVILWSGNHIGHHSTIGDHVFVASHVVISGHVKVKPYCFFGVNATIRDGITIGEASFIGMGANIVNDTEAQSVYSTTAATLRNKKSSEMRF